jgi:transposase
LPACPPALKAGRFTERGKNPLVANVAIARELAGWCWSLATL